jgi:hypothetical protein
MEMKATINEVESNNRIIIVVDGKGNNYLLLFIFYLTKFKFI